MNDISDDKWQRVKLLASRLQALKSILEILDTPINNYRLGDKLNPLKEQLEADFDQTLAALIALIDDDES